MEITETEKVVGDGEFVPGVNVETDTVGLNAGVAGLDEINDADEEVVPQTETPRLTVGVIHANPVTVPNVVGVAVVEV